MTAEHRVVDVAVARLVQVCCNVFMAEAAVSTCFSQTAKGHNYSLMLARSVDAALRLFEQLTAAYDVAVTAVMQLQGTVSRKGSMTGGWTGSSGSYAKTCWTNKQRHDKTLHQLHACRQQLSIAEAEGLSLQQQRAAAEAHLASAQQRQQLLQEVLEARAEAAAAAAAVAQEQQQLEELQGRSTDLQQRLQQYRAALGQDCTADAAETAAEGKGQKGKGSSRGRRKAGMGGESAAVVLRQQLQAQVESAHAAVKSAEQQLEEAQDKVRSHAAQHPCIQAHHSLWVCFN